MTLHPDHMDAHWLREIDRGNGPLIPVQVIAALEVQGLVCRDGILTVLTQAGRYRLASVRSALPAVRPTRRRGAPDRT